ncbi:flagella synthesis protein FlgN [Propionivibrio sp.]|uniref:flagella synthesis protein FlgN n=1 Tax=Propionivibrio sp. TaxID=2212460 RepID=UPI003BF39B5C
MTAETSAFLQALVAEAETVQQFVDLLKLEQTDLSSGKTNDLPAFAEKKATLAAHLNRFATRRNTALAAQGFDADRAGVEAWCANHSGVQEAVDAWSRIISLAGEARELNRLNGELIRTRMHYNARALEALQGGKTSLDLYGPDGQSKSSGIRRINDAV